MKQEIKFCLASDNTRLAYAQVGQGPPLVKAGNWLSHLEYDWDSPVWRPWLDGWSRFHTFYRYDQRGCGLSDWTVSDFSFDSLVADLEAIVAAAGLDRFDLFGMSQGGSIAIAYAARHPERVARLIIYGGYVRGQLRRSSALEKVEAAELELRLLKLSWGNENPAYRQVFTTQLIPEGTPAQFAWYNELQRVSTSPENSAKLQGIFNAVDVRELAKTLRVPTLVLQAKNDAAVPFEEGRLTAAHIPGARFVPLDSKNHVLLSTESAWSHFWDEFYHFLGARGDKPRASQEAAATPSSTDVFSELSARERDVLRLLITGYQNAEIAQTLALSPKTVRNYVSNIYAKLQVDSRREAISLARQRGYAEDGG